MARGDGRIVGGEVWQEKVHKREGMEEAPEKYITEREWKKLLRMPRNRRILHM